MTSSYSRMCLRDSKFWVSTAFCAASMRREIMPLSMGTPSSMPRRWSSVLTHSRAKMRMRSSSSERIEAGGAGVALAAGAAAELVIDAAGFVALGAEDVEAAGGDDGVVLLLRGGGVGGDGGIPLGLGGFELLAGVVEADHAGAGVGCDHAFGGGDGAGLRLPDEVLAGHELGVAAEQDVGAAAGHVGGDGDHAEAAGLGDDLGFLLVELGVEDDVTDALALEDVGEQLGFFDAGGADQDGLLLFVEAGDLVGDGETIFPSRCGRRRRRSRCGASCGWWG